MKISPRLISLLAGGLCISAPVWGAFDGTFDVDGHMNPLQILDAGDPGYSGYEDCALCHANDLDMQQHIQDIMASVHWTWEMTDSATGEPVGKYNVINNYCVAVASNEPRCTSCHIGVGWRDASFDRSKPDHIDCLVCHDGTGTYKKNPMGAGAPLNPETLDFAAIIQSFQSPDRDNCGACHFFGGGGEGVKHGSMDSSLSDPAVSVDAHMGRGVTCVDCHTYGAANPVAFTGSRYSKDTHDAQMCIDCHTDVSSGSPDPAAAHSAKGLPSKHFNVLACQTCHIPAMARGGKATKTWWDWKTAGNYIAGEGTKIDRVVRNGDGDIVYHSKKGSFVWGYDIVPEYEWANGDVDHIQVSDPIDPNARNHINVLQSTFDNPGLLFPVKKFVGRQPYDTVNNNLVVPHLFPTAAEKADPSISKAYWQKYDWELAAEAGMAAYGSSFDSATSDIGFAETDFTWIQNHMVAPAAEAVQCWECHNSKDRMDMASLGFTGYGLAQTDDYNVTYAGYRILLDDPANPSLATSQIIDTGAWMGYLEVSNAPWVFSYNLGKYLYMPEDGSGMFGSWTYMAK